MFVYFSVYRKSTKLPLYCRQEKSTGETVNLMSNDTERVFHFWNFFVIFLVSPFFVLVMSSLLIIEVGWAGVVGLALLFITIPFNMFLGKRMARFKKRALKSADDRIKFLGEMLAVCFCYL